MRLDPEKNRVPGHRDVREHVESVMGFVKGQMRDGAEVEIIGVAEGAEEIVHFLDGNWSEWRDRVAGVCVGLGFVWRVLEEVSDEGFKAFWGKVSTALLFLLCFSLITPQPTSHIHLPFDCETASSIQYPG